MTDTLNQYHALQQNPQDLGCRLPTLSEGQLEVKAQRVSLAELASHLDAWHAATGWYQTTSQIALGMPPSFDNLLEAQWHKEGETLQLKHEQGQQYRLTYFKAVAINTDAKQHFCYRDQLIQLRPALAWSHYQFLVYRFWWQQDTNGASQAAWRPLAQQFIGFK